MYKQVHFFMGFIPGVVTDSMAVAMPALSISASVFSMVQFFIKGSPNPLSELACPFQSALMPDHWVALSERICSSVAVAALVARHVVPVARSSCRP